MLNAIRDPFVCYYQQLPEKIPKAAFQSAAFSFSRLNVNRLSPIFGGNVDEAMANAFIGCHCVNCQRSDNAYIQLYFSRPKRANRLVNICGKANPYFGMYGEAGPFFYGLSCEFVYRHLYGRHFSFRRISEFRQLSHRYQPHLYFVYLTAIRGKSLYLYRKAAMI